jgi:hypothetical protein
LIDLKHQFIALFAILILAVSFVPQAKASPIELIANGGFESGFSDWTTTGTPSIAYQYISTNATQPVSENWESGGGMWSDPNGALDITAAQAHSPTHSDNMTIIMTELGGGYYNIDNTFDSFAVNNTVIKFTYWVYAHYVNNEADAQTSDGSYVYLKSSVGSTICSMNVNNPSTGSGGGTHATITFAFGDTMTYGSASHNIAYDTWHNVTTVVDFTIVHPNIGWGQTQGTAYYYVDGTLYGTETNRHDSALDSKSADHVRLLRYYSEAGFVNTNSHFVDDISLDVETFEVSNAYADLKSTDSIKQQWGSSSTPFDSAFLLNTIYNFGFWSKGDAGAAYHHWYTTYVVANGTFNSVVTYLPDGAYDWTYFDVKAAILAWRPSLASPTSNATVSGIYFKSSTTAAIHTYFDYVTLTSISLMRASFVVTDSVTGDPIENAFVDFWVNDIVNGGGWTEWTDYTNSSGITYFDTYDYWGLSNVSITSNGYINMQSTNLPFYSNTTFNVSLVEYPYSYFINLRRWEVNGTADADPYQSKITFQNGTSILYDVTTDAQIIYTDSRIQSFRYPLFPTALGNRTLILPISPITPIIPVAPASFSFPEMLDQFFELFGVVGFITQLITLLTAFGAWFSDATTTMITIAGQIVSMILGVGGFLFYWTGMFIDVFLQIGTIFSNLWYGIGTITTGLGNLTTWLGPNVFPLVAIWAVFSYIDSIPIRAKMRGVSILEVGIADAQMGYGLFMIFFDFLHIIWNDLVSLVMSLASIVGVG